MLLLRIVQLALQKELFKKISSREQRVLLSSVEKNSDVIQDERSKEAVEKRLDLSWLPFLRGLMKSGQSMNEDFKNHRNYNIVLVVTSLAIYFFATMLFSIQNTDPIKQEISTGLVLLLRGSLNFVNLLLFLFFIFWLLRFVKPLFFAKTSFFGFSIILAFIQLLGLSYISFDIYFMSGAEPKLIWYILYPIIISFLLPKRLVFIFSMVFFVFRRALFVSLHKIDIEIRSELFSLNENNFFSFPKYIRESMFSIESHSVYYLSLVGFILLQRYLFDLKEKSHRVKTEKLSRDLDRIHEDSTTIFFKAYVDTLTGLYNRAMMEVKMEKVIKKAQEEGLLMIFLFIDLNKFKLINDTYGHRSGDYTLTILAERIRDTLIDAGIITMDESPFNNNENNFIARLSGDEFIVLIMEDPEKELNPKNSVKTLCKKILKNSSNKILLPGFRSKKKISLTVSIGAFILPFYGQSAHMKIIDWQQIRSFMLRNADENMYYAKQKNIGFHQTSYSGDDFSNFH